MDINKALNEKVSDALNIIDNNLRKENLNSLIEVSKEIAELAQEARENPGDPFSTEEEGWLEDIGIMDEVLDGKVDVGSRTGAA